MAQMNRDQLPIAWVAHANGQLIGTAALRVHDPEGREDLTPWLGGVFVASQCRHRGIGAALCATVEDAARTRGYRPFICLRSTNKRGTHVKTGRYLPRVFGTTALVT
jgi:GNAT superfamily N-acetyltransferase